MNAQLQEMLVKLAEKLGTTVEHLWEVVNKQVVIDGWTNIAFYLVIPLLFYLYYRYIKYLETRKESYGLGFDAEMIHIFGSIIFGGLLVVCVIAMFCTFSETIACFVNPEYVALYKVMHMLAGITQ